MLSGPQYHSHLSISPEKSFLLYALVLRHISFGDGKRKTKEKLLNILILSLYLIFFYLIFF